MSRQCMDPRPLADSVRVEADGAKPSCRYTASAAASSGRSYCGTNAVPLTSRALTYVSGSSRPAAHRHDGESRWRGERCVLGRVGDDGRALTNRARSSMWPMPPLLWQSSQARQPYTTRTARPSIFFVLRLGPPEQSPRWLATKLPPSNCNGCVSGRAPRAGGQSRHPVRSRSSTSHRSA